MNKQTVYYAVFWHVGTFFANESRAALASSDPYAISWPDSAYAARIFKREDVIDGDKTYRGEPEQVGPTWWPKGSLVQTLEEVRSNPKATPTLIANMEANGWSHIVWTRFDNFPQPFDACENVVL